MAKEKKHIIKYGNTFIKHYSVELGKLYNKFNEDLYHFDIKVKPEDLQGVRSVNVSKQGLLVLSCTDSGVVKSFDVKDGTIPFIYEGHSRTVRMLSFNQNEKLLITGSWDGTIHVLDLIQRKQLKKFSGMGRIPCAYMHDNYIWSGSYDGDISPDLNNRGRLIDYQTGNTLHFFNHGPSLKNQNECIDLLFIPPETIISGSDDGRIYKWRIDITNQNPVFLMESKPLKSCVRKMTLSPDCKLFAIGSGDGSIRIYNVGNLDPLKIIKHGHKEDVMDIRFSPDQRFLYSGSFDMTVKKWDLATGKEIFKSSEPEGWIWTLFLFNDILIAGSADGKVYFYDNTGKLQCVYHNLTDLSSFLWTSPTDPLNPEGSFFTNNPDLIQISKNTADGSVMISGDEEKNYFQRHNNPLILQKIMNPKSFEEKVNSIQDKKKKNSLRFFFPPSKQIGSGSDNG